MQQLVDSVDAPSSLTVSDVKVAISLATVACLGVQTDMQLVPKAMRVLTLMLTYVHVPTPRCAPVCVCRDTCLLTCVPVRLSVLKNKNLCVCVCVFVPRARLMSGSVPGS